MYSNVFQAGGLAPKKTDENGTHWMNLGIRNLKLTGFNRTLFGRTLRQAAVAGLSALAWSTLTISARADLVTNGGFETTTNGPGEFDTSFTQAPGWTSSGYNFIFAPGAADTTGSYTPQYNGNLLLWGPNLGSNNGLPATSPAGGNYVAADGAFEVGAISQTINGLTVGDSYTLSFWWAGAQQDGFTGPNTEQWDVSLGSQTQFTAVVDNASHGFTGWHYQTFTYTATSASEVLSFLALGTPNGEPPFSLLDGVSLDPTAVPEPGSMALMLGILGFMGGVAVFKSNVFKPKKWAKS
jgi:hypothetical protein